MFDEGVTAIYMGYLYHALLIIHSFFADLLKLLDDLENELAG